MDDKPRPSGIPADGPESSVEVHSTALTVDHRPPARPPPYTDAVVLGAVALGVVLLGIAALLLMLTTGTDGDWTRFDDSIDCGSPLAGVFGLCAFAMLLGGVTVVVIGLRRAVGARSWASALVSVAGLCLFVSGVSCVNLAVQVSYAAPCD